MPLKKRKSQKNPSKTPPSTKSCQNGGKRKSYKKQNKQSKKNPSKTSKKSSQTGGKLNAYFKLMLDAKKKDMSSFTYNGNTYKQFTAKTGLKMYKKA